MRRRPPSYSGPICFRFKTSSYQKHASSTPYSRHISAINWLPWQGFFDQFPIGGEWDEEVRVQSRICAGQGPEVLRTLDRAKTLTTAPWPTCHERAWLRRMGVRQAPRALPEPKRVCSAGAARPGTSLVIQPRTRAARDRWNSKEARSANVILSEERRGRIRPRRIRKIKSPPFVRHTERQT